MAWVAVGGAALSVGGSMLANKGAKGGTMSFGPSAYQSMSGQQKANYDSLSNNNTNYINQNMQRINSGRAPEFAENLIASQQPWLNSQLKQQYMGRAGDRGGSVFGMGQQNAAMAGLNPKARIAQMSKSFQDYQQGQQQIAQQMAQLRYDSSSQMANNLPGWSQAQQNGTAQANQVGGGYMTPGTQGKYAGLGQAMGGIGGAMFGQGLGGMMGGGAKLPVGNTTGSAGGGYSGMMPQGMGIGNGSMMNGYSSMNYLQ